SYTVTVNDANGCSSAHSNAISVTVSSPAAPTVSAGGPTTFCAGGSVVLTATGTGTTFQWYEGTTPIAGANSSTLTVTAAGAYSVEEIVGTCTSAQSSATTVTVNPSDNPSISYTNTVVCVGAPNETPTIATPGGTFTASPAGLVFEDPTTGEIDGDGSAPGIYTIKYKTAGSCPESMTVQFEITSAPSASFTYPNPDYCQNATDPIPSITLVAGGVFSSSGGLNINSSTGVIDLSASMPGMYSVKYTIPASGSCPLVADSVDVEILESPTATVSGGGSICGSSTATVTVTLTGAGPWEFDLSDGTNVIPVTNVGTTPYT